MTIRRIAALLAVLAGLAGAAYGAYWFHAAGQVRKGISAWAEDLRRRGWTVEWDELEVEGFPGHIHTVARNPRLTWPDGTEWQAELVRAKVPPLNPAHVRFNAGGLHRLSWPGGPQINLLGQSLRGDLHLRRDGSLEDATVLGAGLQLSERDGLHAEVGSLALLLDPMEVAAPTHQTATVKFSGTAQDVTLPQVPGLMLDRKVSLAEITGRVLGAAPGRASADAVAKWSSDGGTVELDHVALDWAPMGLEGEGTLALDGDLQPLASLTARVRGFDQLMDRLAQSGAIDTGAASGAKILLSMFVKPDPKGRPAIPVPVSFQQGTLYLGPAKVAQFPPVDWVER